MPPARRSKPRSPEHAALGEAVRIFRENRKLSQEELARLARTDLTQIGGIERGVRNPSYTTLVRLTTALETTPGTMISFAEGINNSRISR